MNKKIQQLKDIKIYHLTKKYDPKKDCGLKIIPLLQSHLSIHKLPHSGGVGGGG